MPQFDPFKAVIFSTNPHLPNISQVQSDSDLHNVSSSIQQLETQAESKLKAAQVARRPVVFRLREGVSLGAALRALDE